MNEDTRKRKLEDPVGRTWIGPCCGGTKHEDAPGTKPVWCSVDGREKWLCNCCWKELSAASVIKQKEAAKLLGFTDAELDRPDWAAHVEQQLC